VSQAAVSAKPSAGKIPLSIGTADAVVLGCPLEGAPTFPQLLAKRSGQAAQEPSPGSRLARQFVNAEFGSPGEGTWVRGWMGHLPGRDSLSHRSASVYGVFFAAGGGAMLIRSPERLKATM